MADRAVFGSDDRDWTDLVDRARAGSLEALGQLLECFRPFLLQMAEEDLGSGLRPKAGASDVVQQSFLEAQRDFKSFRGLSREEALAWLRHILQNNLLDFARRYHATDKRQLNREVSFDEVAGVDGLPGDSTTASQLVGQREQWERTLQGLERLSAEQQEVIRLRHQEGKTFKEIGQALQRSEEATRKIWARAIDELRLNLGGGDGG